MTTQDNLGGWRKSSFSDTGNGCVEINSSLSALRDSKNQDGPSLAVEVRQLVKVASDWRLD